MDGKSEILAKLEVLENLENIENRNIEILRKTKVSLYPGHRGGIDLGVLNSLTFELMVVVKNNHFTGV